jgi:hypothetical protein
MAPEIVLQECARVRKDAVVLDPMAGSGTVLRYASSAGHRALGYDLDPLSVLMARVWNTPLDTTQLRRRAARLSDEARGLSMRWVSLPWMDVDEETRRFVNYWFGRKQQRQLRALASLLSKERGRVGDAMRVALSRTIITKEPKASLARDTSHSRPHRVIRRSEFEPIEAFLRSANWLADRLRDQPPPGAVAVRLGDARKLRDIPSSSVDLVVSSPPYLNAIDYMRGHRLTLVWLGHTLAELRATRARSVGSERGPDAAPTEDVSHLLTVIDPLARFSNRLRGIVERYAADMLDVVRELERVLRPNSKVILVLGSCSVQGSFIESASVVGTAAEMVGFRIERRAERPLLMSRRYLPPPGKRRHSGLDDRMRTETVLTFRKVANRKAASG